METGTATQWRQHAARLRRRGQWYAASLADVTARALEGAATARRVRS